MAEKAWIYKDDEEKTKKRTSVKKAASQDAKQKEKLAKDKEKKEELKADEALSTMKDMINDDDLELSLDQVELIKKVISNNDISQDDVEEILEKIEEIEKTEDVDKYLPQEFRITWEEYKKALTDDIARIQTITKINTALTILAQHVTPDSAMWLNLFSGYMAMLDKKLIKIQENHIDIKDNLEKVEELKNPNKQDNLGLWDKFKIFFK
jgi:hypothetical protein